MSTPASSKAQQRLFAAALAGASFPEAAQLRASVPATTLRDFAEGSMKGKPNHVQAPKAAPKPAKAAKHVPAAVRAALPPHVKRAGHPGINLGRHLHPRGGIR